MIVLLRSIRLIALVVVLGLVVPGFAQDSVELKWKFEKDKTFYQEMTTTTKQTMKVMNMDITQNHSQTFWFSWAPVSLDEKTKEWKVKQKILGAQMEIEISGNKITFDSRKDAGTGSTLQEFFKALVGTEFTLTISEKMEVAKIEGREEFLKKLNQTNPMMEPLLKQILGDEALKQMADPAFAVVPGKAVKKGDTWKKTSKMNMGPIGTYESEYTYTYEGKDGKLDKIKQDTTLKYTAPSGDAGAILPFKIKSADLKSKEATGTILFDNDKGRVDKTDLKLKLDGKLIIDIGGSSTEVDLSQEQNTSVKTLETNPIPEKK
jgi:hypothetical protein